ncbi:MAG: phosphate ABC transporter ATP-binding protein [Panacagrimonas sp.]
MSACQAVLQTRGLSLAYGSHYAFRDVSIGFAAHTVTALIGPSGCGKSSLLMSLNRLTDLVSGCRIEGCVCFHGLSVHLPQTDLAGLRRRVGMIFQKPHPFPLSIRRNLELPLLERGIRRKADQDLAIERVLREAGLWEEVRDRLHAPALALSGGQQQRLCIARALTLEPEVLLMDEPCSALDPLSSAVVEDLIQRLKERYTLVVVTHNLAQARRISDYCGAFWMREGSGRLIEFDRTETLFSAPRDPLVAAYIDGRRG